ncbi:thiamine phosphate synthase [Corynebacterium alimapuense]|uniref:Thiamine-phosphate synthase n=1 Tax=Corynebacterium alimapuense TaxID=1576874 RepID=A0A3M8K7D2_9CORY|nr:thiamine phosphate synthase [Corynebacterium alimapuense]RNE49123.1 thiamine phosphate synthase [Corynebacterium alimapuense]
MSVDWSLYLVTDPHLGGGPDQVVEVVSRALEGGVTVVQLRDKFACDAEVEETAEQLLEILGDVPLFLNDRVKVARRLGCHLHIGQNDMPYALVRELLAPDQMIGLSVGTTAEFDALAELTVPLPDVIGIGPAFDTTTKADAPAGRGVAHVNALAARAASAGMASVAIGGINAQRAPLFSDTRVDGICVVSSIMAADDPAASAREIRKAFRG